MKQRLYCFNRWRLKEEIDKIAPDGIIPENYAIIQICGTWMCQKYVLQEKENFYLKSNNNVLNLKFDDVGKDWVRDGWKFYRGITYEQAKQLVSFIDENKNKNFFISCRAGHSRSQGIIRYILDMYPDINWETNPNNPCNTPNSWVTAKLKLAFYNLGYAEKLKIEEEEGSKVVEMKQGIFGVKYTLENGCKIIVGYDVIKNDIW